MTRLLRGTIAVQALLILAFSPGCSRWVSASAVGRKAPLRLVAGPELKAPLHQAVQAFRKKYGVRVEEAYSELCAAPATAPSVPAGDVYLAPEPGEALSAEWTGAVLPESRRLVCFLNLGICVPKRNPKNIRGLQDLGRAGVRVAIQRSDVGALGALTDEMLAQSGLRDAVAKNVVARATCCEEVATTLTSGAADAALTWDRDAHLAPDKIEAIPLARDLRRYVPLHASVLAGSSRRQAAQKLADFLASPDGRRPLESTGFATKVDKVPFRITGGAAGKGGADALAEALADELQVDATVTYVDGCKAMEHIEKGEIDEVFVPGQMDCMQIAIGKNLVARDTVTTLGYVVPAILVRTGNPKNVRSLQDLLRPDLRFGMGGPNTATGKTAKRVFEAVGLKEKILARNPVLGASCGATFKLLLDGQADAVIAWRHFALTDRRAEAIEFPNALDFKRDVVAAVPVCTPYKYYARQFVQLASSDYGREILSKAGFVLPAPADAKPLAGQAGPALRVCPLSKPDTGE